MPTQLCRLTKTIPLIAAAGDLAVLATAPEEMRLIPGAVVAMTAAGFTVVAPDEHLPLGEPGPYDDFEDANANRAKGVFSLRPFRAEDLLRDLVAQLDAIGVPEWHGAEGLVLDDARAFLAVDGPEQLRQARLEQRERDGIGWDEPDFPYEDWQAEVANGDTRVSYAEFVMRNREQELTGDEVAA